MLTLRSVTAHRSDSCLSDGAPGSFRIKVVLRALIRGRSLPHLYAGAASVHQDNVHVSVDVFLISSLDNRLKYQTLGVTDGDTRSARRHATQPSEHLLRRSASLFFCL